MISELTWLIRDGSRFEEDNGTVLYIRYIQEDNGTLYTQNVVLMSRSQKYFSGNMRCHYISLNAQSLHQKLCQGIMYFTNLIADYLIYVHSLFVLSSWVKQIVLMALGSKGDDQIKVFAPHFNKCNMKHWNVKVQQTETGHRRSSQYSNLIMTKYSLFW